MEKITTEKNIHIRKDFQNKIFKTQHTVSSDTADANEIFDGLRGEPLKLEVLDLFLYLCLLFPPQSLRSFTTHLLWKFKLQPNNKKTIINMHK